MTTIHTFEDILAVMDRDPELRDAMHRHVLSEEILQLPAAVRQIQDMAVSLAESQAELSATTRSAIEATANTLAQFIEQTTLLMNNASERQAAIENDIAELREGQGRLTAAVEELRERVNRLESITNQILADLTELKAGMARANERLDGLETGQSELKAGQARANERLDGLETGQSELKAGQSHANERLDRLEAGQAHANERLEGLEAGMARANERLDNLETGMAHANERLDSLETGQAELKAGQAELKAGQESMQGQINRLTGSDYERRIIRLLRRSAERRFGLHNAAVLQCITMPDNAVIPNLLDAAMARGDITEDEANDAELADIIIGGRNDADDPAYVVIEASVTIDHHDLDRAVSRAAVIGKAANASAISAVAGTAILESERERADANSVAVIILSD